MRAIARAETEGRVVTFDRSLADGLEWDVELARRIAHEADFAEGTEAFLAGREPEFPDR